MTTYSGNLSYKAGGFFFSDIYYGATPEFLTLPVLSGTVDQSSFVEFQRGATYSGGSLLIGLSGSGGTLQVFDLSTRQVVSVIGSPPMVQEGVEDLG